MVLLFTKSGSEIIKDGSIIGTHEIKVFDDCIIANDTGGIFASAKKSVAFYKSDEVKVEIETDGYNDRTNKVTFSSQKQGLNASFYTELRNINKLLFETQLKNISFKNISLKNSEIRIDALIQHPNGLRYIKINYKDAQLKMYHNFGIETLYLKEISSIQSHGENVFMITATNVNYKVAVNTRAKKLLEQLILDLKILEEIGSSAESIELKLRDMTCLGFIKGQTFELYNAATLQNVNIFYIKNMQLYLGETKLLIQHNDVLMACENSVAKKLCVDLKLIPKKLHQFNMASFLHQTKGKHNITDLVCFLDEGKYKFYSIATHSIIFSTLEEDVKVSEQNPEVIVLPDGLLHVGRTVDFVSSVNTPTTYFSTTGFPMYFERVAYTIRVSIPGATILEECVEDFYSRSTKQDGDVIAVQGVAKLALCLPLQAYKSLFKEHLYELRSSTLKEVHTEKVLVSRARNMSDLLLFEFFGQWQIILDYVQQKMKKDSFTEEEITQFGLYLYHATFQQRKRMEEIASKYPQFMYALSQDLMVNPKLNQIYQKQQREMFQLAAQMKSQFTEVESLLSQITYIHFNNDEYQKLLREAQNVASKKKVGVSVALGIGIGIASGGVGLLIPAMTMFTEWINSGQRKELDEIQREKEFKKNEFLFKKAIDLILHMNDFTINYHVQMLNQFTYNNLRLEAEVLATDNTEAYKEKLLKQSIDVYSKISLPIDYDTQLKPRKLVASILTAPVEATNKTVSLFLE